MFNSISNFYPTKKETAYKLFNMFYETDKKKFTNCVHLLEPSAGKGDLIEAFYNYLTDKLYLVENKMIFDYLYSNINDQSAAFCYNLYLLYKKVESEPNRYPYNDRLIINLFMKQLKMIN